MITTVEEGKFLWEPPFAICEKGRYICPKCERGLAGKQFLVCWFCEQIYRFPPEPRLEIAAVVSALETLEGWVVQQDDGQSLNILEAIEILKTIFSSPVRRASRVAPTGRVPV